MILQRGDVLKACFPHASGGRGKKRPIVVVQADVYNQRLRHAIVAQVTTNLDEKDDPACLFVEATTPEAKATGLDRESLFRLVGVGVPAKAPDPFNPPQEPFLPRKGS